MHYKKLQETSSSKWKLCDRFSVIQEATRGGLSYYTLYLFYKYQNYFIILFEENFKNVNIINDVKLYFLDIIFLTEKASEPQKFLKQHIIYEK